MASILNNIFTNALLGAPREAGADGSTGGRQGGILSDLFAISIPGQRLAAVRAQREEDRARRLSNARDASAYKALQSGDIAGASAYNPELAARAAQVQGFQQQQAAAEEARQRNLAIDGVRFFKQGLANGRDPATLAAQGKAYFSRFADPASVNEFFDTVAANPDNLDAFAATIAAGDTKPTQRYLNTSKGVFDTETQQYIAPPDDGSGGLDAEYKRAQIDAARALAEQRRTPKVSAADAKAAAAAEKTAAGKETLSSSLSDLARSYLTLSERGGIVQPGRGSAVNIKARLESSLPGQIVGGATGSENQSIRERINNMRPLLINSIREASGLSAKAIDSNAELKFYLQAATDPTKDIYSNLAAIDTLDKIYGLGNVLEDVLPPEVLQRVRSQTGQPSPAQDDVFSAADAIIGG